MREVVDGVFEVTFGYVHMHLVVTDDGVVLVDTGLPRRSKKIDRALRDLRRAIGDVRTVLLTHNHPDHTGNVADIRRRSGARVIAAAGGRGGKIISSPRAMAADYAEQERSVAKLASFDFEHAVFGHGRAVSGNAVERFREYAAQHP